MSLRGAKRRGNLLEESRKPYEIPGDCHVGLCPPRNDVENRAWSFCCWCGSGHPGRGVPTGFYFGSFAALGTSYSSHRRAVGLRPPTPPFMVGIGTTARVAPKDGPLTLHLQLQKQALAGIQGQCHMIFVQLCPADGMPQHIALDARCAHGAQGEGDGLLLLFRG